VLRFARICADSAAPTDGELISSVCIDEHSVPVGRIIRVNAQWDYHLAGRAEVILSSALSRQDLERQIVLLHLGELTAATGPNSDSIHPVFAAAV
jgi:hypothetical protein